MSIVTIGGETIELNKTEIKAAKKMIVDFFEKVKVSSMDHNVPSLYFTTLILSYIMSQDYLKALTPEALKTIMDSFNHIDQPVDTPNG